MSQSSATPPLGDATVQRNAASPAAPAATTSRKHHSTRSQHLRYAVATLVVAGVTFLRLPLAPLLGNSVPFILYFPAVVVAGWFGGFGPGMLATLLSAYCAKTWFFEPFGTFTIPDWGSAFRLALFLASGGLIGFLCGRLHQRSEELELEKAGLEAAVRERTLHLELALRDMEAFSYTASHDLRSPLRAMHGFSEILLEQYGPQLDAEGQGYLNRIRGAADRLDTLINNLLAFAKVSGSSIELRPLALRDAVTRVRASSPRWTSPEVTIDDQGCTHTVLANETLLDQVIQNLLENAAKFVAPGVPPRIRLWSEASGKTVRLWLEDNGIGIASADQQRLFQIFERGSATSYSGTGIGLAIVDRAVTRMNGRVGLESEPGRGSRFWFELAAP